MKGLYFVFPVKSFLSGFWTTLSGLCPDEPVIDLTAISTRGLTILSIAVKHASYIHFLTVMRALSNVF